MSQHSNFEKIEQKLYSNPSLYAPMTSSVSVFTHVRCNLSALARTFGDWRRWPSVLPQPGWFVFLPPPSCKICRDRGCRTLFYRYQKGSFWQRCVFVVCQPPFGLLYIGVEFFFLRIISCTSNLWYSRTFSRVRIHVTTPRRQRSTVLPPPSHLYTYNVLFILATSRSIAVSIIAVGSRYQDVWPGVSLRLLFIIVFILICVLRTCCARYLLWSFCVILLILLLWQLSEETSSALSLYYI
jgi:hypothetical protein